MIMCERSSILLQFARRKIIIIIKLGQVALLAVRCIRSRSALSAGAGVPPRPSAEELAAELEFLASPDGTALYGAQYAAGGPGGAAALPPPPQVPTAVIRSVLNMQRTAAAAAGPSAPSTPHAPSTPNRPASAVSHGPSLSRFAAPAGAAPQQQGEGPGGRPHSLAAQYQPPSVSPRAAEALGASAPGVRGAVRRQEDRKSVV